MLLKVRQVDVALLYDRSIHEASMPSRFINLGVGEEIEAGILEVAAIVVGAEGVVAHENSPNQAAAGGLHQEHAPLIRAEQGEAHAGSARHEGMGGGARNTLHEQAPVVAIPILPGALPANNALRVLGHRSQAEIVSTSNYMSSLMGRVVRGGLPITGASKEEKYASIYRQLRSLAMADGHSYENVNLTIAERTVAALETSLDFQNSMVEQVQEMSVRPGAAAADYADYAEHLQRAIADRDRIQQELIDGQIALTAARAAWAASSNRMEAATALPVHEGSDGEED